MARTTPPDQDLLGQILSRQVNVITRSQALAVGVTVNALRHRLRPGGPWQRLLPGVYIAVTGTPTIVQQEMAALLHAGRGSVITGAAAVRHHRIRGPGGRDVRAVVADAVQRGSCTVPDLAAELAAGPNVGSALFREALTDVADGIRSAAEGDLRDLLIRSGLPMPLFNPKVYAGNHFIASPDAWWPELGVAVEVDTRQWHLSPEDHANTLARGRRMAIHQLNVLRFAQHEAALLRILFRASASFRRVHAYAAPLITPSSPSIVS